MRKLTLILFIIVGLLLSISFSSIAYGTDTSTASPAALKFVEQSASDKEWADIQAVLKNYENSYVNAVNKGDFKAVEPYITPGSAFYSQQKTLVSSLFRQGIGEKLVGYSLERAEYLKDKYKVYVVEKIEVSAPGKAKKVNEYVWIYDVNKTAKGMKIGAIAKWSDYKAYKESAEGRVKTDGYYVDDFGNSYSYQLVDAVNSLYIGRLKEISGSSGILDRQKQLITDMRRLGTGFELVRYQNLDYSFDEAKLTGTSFNSYIFKYQSRDRKETLLDLKIRFDLEEVRIGYSGYAKILDMKVESFESITVPLSGKTLQSFIPKGWKLFEKAEGDLNKDGLADTAAVVEEDRRWEIQDFGNAPGRILIILLKQKDGSFKLGISSLTTVLKADEGGVFGDPFDRISIKGGVLSLGFYGGSNYRWGYTYKFRFQNNGWFLIGVTQYNIYTGTGEYTTKDFNLSTGKESITKGIEGGKSTVQIINRGKKTLVDLKNFDTANISDAVF
jgi:hypothetical protein